MMAALLDDPTNRAIMERESLRRDRGKVFKPLLPPVKVDNGWKFYAFRESVSSLAPANPNALSEFEVFSDGDKWFIQDPAETEIGPFDTSREALNEARAMAEAHGFTLLKRLPWDQEDLNGHPM